MTTANNDQGFREIRMMAGAIALILLALHFYFTCYGALRDWGYTIKFVDRVLHNLGRSGLFRGRFISKGVAFCFMLLTLIGGTSGSSTGTTQSIIRNLAIGLALYLGGDGLLYLRVDLRWAAGAYIVVSLTGFALLYGVARSVAGVLQMKFLGDIFNRYNESFPQEERLLTNPYYVNLRGRYSFRNQTRNSWININSFKGTLICGQPGSGKTRYIFRQIIQQHVAKGFTAFIFDFKFDDLTRLAYNTLERVGGQLAVKPAFYVINFEDFSRSHRCNPLDPASMADISDAAESARTILFGLNRKWVHSQGDFFVESAVGFFTANIWFLRKYEDGKYCTLPHLIELIQSDFDKLFSVLQSYPEVETLIHSFASAYANNTMDQLQGQVDSARIPLSALASPQIYYLLSANDFTLDINNPEAPKVVCCGSNPQKQQVFGAIISLYVSRMIKLVNRKGCLPCSLVFDELPTLYFPGLDTLMATARSNRVAATIGIQDLSQLRKEYGKDQADALFNLPGNLICGQVSGDTAKLVSERFGKILQEKETYSVNSRDSSTSQSRQLDLAVPPSKIATLSSGEFVGIVADNPDQRIRHKGFHCEIIVDHAAIEREEAAYKPLPEVRTVTPELVQFNFNQIKAQTRQLVDDRLAYMAATPSLARLIIRKKDNQQRLRKGKV